MRKIDDLTEFLRNLLWNKNQKEDDPIVAAVSIRTEGSMTEHFMLQKSEIPTFNPEIHQLAVDAITNEEQQQLALEEQVYLASTYPEVARYLHLQGLVEDYREELREF